MKLQKIKDVRVGQIWFHKNFYYLITEVEYNDSIKKHNAIFKVFEFNFPDIKFSYHDYVSELFLKNNTNLVGFLNITHKVEDNKLIEIPREKFEIDDIVKYEGNKMPYIIMEKNTIDEFWLHSNEEDVSGIYKDSMEEEGFKKVGILGVNYEIINDKLIKE